MSDQQAFHDFEHAGWEKLPQRYHDAFSTLTTQAIEPLLDAAGVKRDVRLLDVATGPGYVAAAAAQRGASVIGIDFAAAMVNEARKRNPGTEFRHGDAEELAFDDASFDAVTMNFGLLHLAGPERALAEAHRVLQAGGTLAFTVWAKPEEAVAFGIVLRAIEKHGKTDVDLPVGPPFFRFSDAQECRRALQAAGFANGEVMVVRQTWRLPSPEALFQLMYDSTVRTGGLLRAQTPQALQAIRAEITQAASKYQAREGVELPMPAVLASARKS
jgi:ubiquinone/menaquinone biosynthesis C-methylase UbiE